MNEAWRDNSPTPKSRALLEKPRSQETLRVLWNQEAYLPFSHDPSAWAWIQSASSHSVHFNIHFIIFLPYSKIFQFIYFIFPFLSSMNFSLSCACHMPHSCYASWFHHPNSVVFDVKCKSCSSSFCFLCLPVALSVFCYIHIFSSPPLLKYSQFMWEAKFYCS